MTVIPPTYPRTFDQMLEEANNAQLRIQSTMDMDLFIQADCDEVSLLFATPDDLDAFVEWAVEQGARHFDSSWDEMTLLTAGKAFTSIASPNIEPFDVRFEFLNSPADAKWRIEAMCVTAGSAPLHELQLARYGNGCVMHVSHKVPDIDSYYDRFRELQKQITFFSEYTNSYGRFSYWANTIWKQRIYIKPRVNLREDVV